MIDEIYLPNFKELGFKYLGNSLEGKSYWGNKYYKLIISNDNITCITNVGLNVFNEDIDTPNAQDRAVEFIETMNFDKPLMSSVKQIAVARCNNESPRFWINENNNLLTENKDCWVSLARSSGFLSYDYFGKKTTLRNTSLAKDLIPGTVWLLVKSNENGSQILIDNNYINISNETLDKLLVDSIKTTEKTRGLLLLTQEK